MYVLLTNLEVIESGGCYLRVGASKVGFATFRCGKDIITNSANKIRRKTAYGCDIKRWES